MIALMMEAARSSETLVNFYQTTQRNNPEDSNLRTNRRENIKSYILHPYAGETLLYNKQTNTNKLACFPKQHI
jgi:hypothetical protein